LPGAARGQRGGGGGCCNAGLGIWERLRDLGCLPSARPALGSLCEIRSMPCHGGGGGCRCGGSGVSVSVCGGAWCGNSGRGRGPGTRGGPSDSRWARPPCCATTTPPRTTAGRRWAPCRCSSHPTPPTDSNAASRPATPLPAYTCSYVRLYNDRGSSPVKMAPHAPHRTIEAVNLHGITTRSARSAYRHACIFPNASASS
jgi:hypothetical protein